MATVNGVIITYKSKGKIINKETKKLGNRAYVAPDAPANEEVAVATPNCFSAKPTAKAVQSKAAVQRAEPQLALQSAAHKGGSLSSRRQPFTWGGQTVMIH